MTSEKANGVQIHTSDYGKGTKDCQVLSDLAKIELKSEDPLELFREWHEEARKFSTGKPDAVCLATVSKDLKMNVRHLVIRDYDQRGFIIVTDSRSQKSKELAEVPNAAMCILWAYNNERQQEIARQVRMAGKVEKLLPEDFRYLYDREPIYCKIRSYLCRQGQQVDWDELKSRHDKLVHEASTGAIDLSMPDHFAGYRLIPETFEYYHAYDHFIADRVLFVKKSGKWTHERIAA